MQRIIEVIVSLVIDEEENAELFNNDDVFAVVRQYVDGLVLSDCDYGIGKDFKVEDIHNEEWKEVQ